MSLNNRSDLVHIITENIRPDLLEESLLIIGASTDEELKELFDYIEKRKGKISTNSFINLSLQHLDFLKTKLEFFGRIPVRESELGLPKEYIQDLIARWRAEKLDQFE